MYTLSGILVEVKPLAKLPLILAQSGFEPWISTTKQKT